MFRILCFVGFFALINANSIRVRLEGNKNFLNTIENVRAERRYVEAKYQAINKKSSVENVEPIKNYAGYPLVYGTVYIGTPPQALKVLFDTTSITTWVLESGLCSSSAEGCVGKSNGFNSSASTSFDPIYVSFEVTLSESEDGEYGSDVYQVGGVTIQNQFFGHISDQQSSYYYDGVFGLCMNYQWTNVSKMPLLNMMEQHLLDEAKYSMYISTTSDNLVGEVIFGDSDSSLYNGELIQLPTSSNNDPTCYVELSSLVMSGRTLAQKLTTAFDTSVYGINTYSLSAYIQINEIIKSTLNSEQEYVVNCADIDQLPNLTFNFEGISLNLPPQSYVQKVLNNGETTCMTVFNYINPSSGENVDNVDLVLGQIFLTVAYVEFNAAESVISLAALNIDSSSSS